ncbi:MAG: DUF4852 domain-containing protein [Alphaproteobacteria bacterium]|nr:DUF4852 domain-containing protein [Alphaproteobacteria bacterium]
MFVIKKVGLLSPCLIFALAMLFFVQAVFAQNKPETSSQSPDTTPKAEVSKSTEVLQNILQKQTGEEKAKDKKLTVVRYVPATPQNIVRLMWALGAYDLNDSSAVSNYIHRIECALYDKYYNDEFEWRKVQLATVSYLKKYAEGFSNYIEIIQPVQIGRYDFDLQGFSIRNENELYNMTAIQISDSRGGYTTCNFPAEEPRFATVAIVKLKNPLNIDFIRVPHALAKEYIRFLEERHGHLVEDKEVYLRYRLRIDRFLQVESLPNIGDSLVFSGKVMQIDVYADQEMFLPLFSQKFD